MSRLLLALAGLALAEEAAWYHPDDVAKASAVFQKVAERTGPAFETRQRDVDRAGAALEDLETGVMLLGDDAPAPVRAWSDDTRRHVTGQVMRLQRHVDLLQEDYGKVFGDALERALGVTAKGYAVKECGGVSLMGMRKRPDCVGTDLNPQLARVIDADPLLAAELDAIAKVEWPTVELPTSQLPVVAMTGTARWVDGGALARKLVAARLEQRREELDRQVGPLLEEGTTEETVAKAKELREAWAKVVAADGKALRDLVTDTLQRLAKKGGPAEVGWCANPPALGGCQGEDATIAVLTALGEDKKFGKAVEGKFGGKP